jgi:phytanoyl-CoA hydroxylase
MDTSLSQQFEEQGYVLLEAVVPEPELDAIRGAAARIVEDFDIERHRTVFTTRDRDFMDSAEAVHCFLEESALDTDGRLNRPREQAINKIGHALHDLVPEFTAFCRLPVFAGCCTRSARPDRCCGRPCTSSSRPASAAKCAGTRTPAT